MKRASLAIGLSALAYFASCLPAFSFWAPTKNGPGHQGITRGVLNGYQIQPDRLNSLPNAPTVTLTFSEFAKEAIVKWAILADNDWLNRLRVPYVPSNHFDNGYSDHRRWVSVESLRLRRQAILDQLSLPGGDLDAVWEELGLALHALQDFYAHSTWVELHNDVSDIPIVDFGKSFLNGTMPDFLNESVSNVAVCLNQGTVLPFSPISTGWYYHPDFQNALPASAMKCAHGTLEATKLHCLFPFYNRDFINKDVSKCEGFDPEEVTNARKAITLAQQESEAFINSIVDELIVDGNLAGICTLLGKIDCSGEYYRVYLIKDRYYFPTTIQNNSVYTDNGVTNRGAQDADWDLFWFTRQYLVCRKSTGEWIPQTWQPLRHSYENVLAPGATGYWIYGDTREASFSANGIFKYSYTTWYGQDYTLAYLPPNTCVGTIHWQGHSVETVTGRLDLSQGDGHFSVVRDADYTQTWSFSGPQCNSGTSSGNYTDRMIGNWPGTPKLQGLPLVDLGTFSADDPSLKDTCTPRLNRP